jgi:hypothetical protein
MTQSYKYKDQNMHIESLMTEMIHKLFDCPYLKNIADS